jgi:2-polyprenyl-3-methyl-5-hydroxy-6-metoxy-1,4-benzoquinol methylase
MFQDYKWLSPELKRTQSIIKPMFEILKEQGDCLKVLDVGCGNGVVSELIVKLGHDVWGIDENTKVLKEARERGVKTFEGTLEKNFPFKNKSFDVVFCLRVLEHIFNTIKFLKECNRVLRKNGILIITADNILSLPNRVRMLFGFYPLSLAPSETYGRYSEHKRCFNKKAFQNILKESEFNIQETTSDFICFNLGQYNLPPRSEFLGKIYPSLGSTLIAKAMKK